MVIDVRVQDATTASLIQILKDIRTINHLSAYSVKVEDIGNLIQQANDASESNDQEKLTQATEDMKTFITNLLNTAKEEARFEVAEAERAVTKVGDITGFIRRLRNDLRTQIPALSGNVEDLELIKTLADQIKKINNIVRELRLTLNSNDTEIVEQIRNLITGSAAIYNKLEYDIGGVIWKTFNAIQSDAMLLVHKLEKLMVQMQSLIESDNNLQRQIDDINRLIQTASYKIRISKPPKITELIDMRLRLHLEQTQSLIKIIANIFKQRIPQLETIRNVLQQKQSIIAMATQGDAQIAA
jgi:hypothetical protein